MTEELLTLAKKVHIYSNGDRFFTGRRFVINPRRTRNYDSFLTQVTLSLQPAFGAVRVLRTPENGHPVGDLADLETGRSYVACAQKFVKLGYEDISSKPKPAPSPERRNKVIASGRIRKIDRTPIAIFVYTNGEVLEPARRILLKPWVQKTWETVLVAINEKINLRTGAVRHVIDYSSKDEVTEGVHLKNNDYYVAVGSERFKDAEYGMQPAVLSPRQQQKRRYPALRPLKKKNKSGNTTDESQGSSPLENSTNSTQSLGKRSDDPPARSKKKAAQQQANTEEGIPMKPIKHKRGSSDKPKDPPVQEPPAEENKKKPAERKRQQPPPPAKQNQPPPPKQNQPPPKQNQPPPPAHKKSTSKSTVDLDKDEGGVFKSKGKKQKATEVTEDKQVKEEVPIDKRKAETVDDEEPESPKANEPLPPTKNNKNKAQPKQKQPVQSSSKKATKAKALPPKRQTYNKEHETAAVTIQASYRGYKTRKELKSKKTEDKYDSKHEAAAVTIQAGYRGHRIRKELKKQKGADTDDTKRHEAAVTIQAGYKGYRVRKELKTKKKESEKTDDKEKAAVKIQASYRGHKARRDLKKKLDENEEKETAAITIQAGYRGYQGRKKVKAMKEERKNDNKDEGEARAQTSQSESNG